ncbi:hypothetical protein NMG60_11033410 [Bertholletia excelsa]
MALRLVICALIFALVLSGVELSTCHVLKGSVTCLDCSPHYSLSDIKVAVKCDGVKKVEVATTEEDGTFMKELPSSTSNCAARLMGGPKQLYVSRKKMISATVKLSSHSNSYTLATPLSFYTSCPFSGDNLAKCRSIISSKTVDLPLPPEWGFAPTSYYVLPFLPIIGIP